MGIIMHASVNSYKFKWNFIDKISVYFLAHSKLEFSFYSVTIICIISIKLFLLSGFLLPGISSLVKSSPG